MSWHCRCKAALQKRKLKIAPARGPRHHHKDRWLARPSRDFVPLRDNFTPIHSDSRQISIG
jgi:hypothetical protein